MKRKVVQAASLGALSSLFLSAGLIVNSLNAYHGGNWAWTASLRYLLLLPVLTVLVALRGRLAALLKIFKQIPGTFLLWGCLGFGAYYALLSYAIRLAPGWLVSAGFMNTVLAGLLLSPLIYDDHRAVISKKALLLSSLLVGSLLLLQLDRIRQLKDLVGVAVSVTLSLIAAFLWPLGNRKLLLKLEREQLHLDPMQRVLGMTIGSLPVLIGLSVYGYSVSGAPTALQLRTSIIAVLFSGVLGSLLFFKAMQMAGQNKLALLTVEATQVLCVLFTLFGEMLFKGMSWPGAYATTGFLAMLVLLLMYTGLAIRGSRNYGTSF